MAIPKGTQKAIVLVTPSKLLLEMPYCSILFPTLSLWFHQYLLVLLHCGISHIHLASAFQVWPVEEASFWKLMGVI